MYFRQKIGLNCLRIRPKYKWKNLGFIRCFWDEHLGKMKTLLLKNNYFHYYQTFSEKFRCTNMRKNLFVKGIQKDWKVLHSYLLNETPQKIYFRNTKANTPLDLATNFTYKIPCTECNKFCILQTGRYLLTRLKERERDNK